MNLNLVFSLGHILSIDSEKIMRAQPYQARRYDQRRTLRQTSMPNLKPSNAPVSLGKVTLTEIPDDELGLDFNPWVQHAAERLISSAIGKAERLRLPFTPIVAVLPNAADDVDDNAPEPDDVAVILAETLAPRSWADEGH